MGTGTRGTETTRTPRRRNRKAANGEGSIFRFTDTKGRERWKYEIAKQGRTPGQQWSFTFATQREAVAKRREIEGEIARHGRSVQSKQTVAVYLDDWIATVVQPSDLAAKTKETYGQYVRLYLRPVLGRYLLRDLQPRHVAAMLADLRAKPGMLGKVLAPRTVAHIRAVLTIALKHAVETGEAAINAAARTKAPLVREKEMKYLDPEEARRFLEAVRGRRGEVLFLTTITLGLRSAEVRGLRWNDLDFAKAEAHIHQQIRRESGAFILRPVKSEKGNRYLSLPPFLMTALKEHKVKQDAERLAVGTAWDDWGLVFCAPRGTPLHSEGPREGLKKALQRAGLDPGVRFHDLRHTAATLALAAGHGLLEVRDMLGHTKVATTERYAHVLADSRKRIAESMERLLATDE